MKLCITTKTAEIAKRCQKRLLRRITGVVFTSEHAEREGEDTSLPAAHNLTEGVGVTSRARSTICSSLVAVLILSVARLSARVQHVLRWLIQLRLHSGL